MNAPLSGLGGLVDSRFMAFLLVDAWLEQSRCDGLLVLPLDPTKSLELKMRKLVSAWMNSSTEEILYPTAKSWLSYVTFSGGFRMDGFAFRKKQGAFCPRTWILGAVGLLVEEADSSNQWLDGRF
jgi:hypothetical protein